METLDFGHPTQLSKLGALPKEELIKRYCLMEAELKRLIGELYSLRNVNVSQEQQALILQEQLGELQNKVFGTSSEKYKKLGPFNNNNDGNGNNSKPAKEPKPRVKSLTERYPDLILREQTIGLQSPPVCQCCSSVMTATSMTEDSEQLTVIPKKFEIFRQKRVKYTCQCHGSVVTTPAPERIIPGSSYSDEMIKDVALSKYVDLIPINRYAAMADRLQYFKLPPHSLIELTHQFADFVDPVYKLLKKEILKARILSADETPHRMLEGDEKKSWYLWGFSTSLHCYLECHDTRSADIASEVLLKSQCEVLLSDVYSGYGKAIRVTNVGRQKQGLKLIQPAHCNAHARRYFKKAMEAHSEAEYYVATYHKIYDLNSESKGKDPPEILRLRQNMVPLFEEMKKRAHEELSQYSRNGKYGKGLRYFLDHYSTLTFFINDPDVPIDNNAQERNLRPHVVGRKTWYGTHSPRGALTAAIMFSIVESCKLVQVNPRQYFDQLVSDLLEGKTAYTPAQFKLTQ